MSRRLVIDTDIGTDVDDLWTLAMLPTLHDVEVEAVTVVYGNTELRARLASVVLLSMGIDVPVYRGCEQTLSAKPPLWAGHEGVGVPGLDDAPYASGDAVDVLVDRAAREPGTLEVLAIGPLTNIATAIGRDPDFASNVGHLTVMGGEFRRGWAEHNFASDARATEIVLASGMAMTIMPLDQTLRVRFDRADVERIASVHPLGTLLADQSYRCWAWLTSLRPTATPDASAAHDPCALLSMVEPSLFTVTSTTVQGPGEAGFNGRVRGTAEAASSIGIVTDLDPVAVHTALLHALGCLLD